MSKVVATWVARGRGGRTGAARPFLPRRYHQSSVTAAAPTHFEIRNAFRRNSFPQRLPTTTSSSSASSCFSSWAHHHHDRPTPSTLISMPPQPKQSPVELDVEELHRLAISEGRDTYTDPATGLTVFTALAHQRRGHCCGSRCRHCPYNDWTTGTATTTRTTTASRRVATGTMKSSDNDDDDSDSKSSRGRLYSDVAETLQHGTSLPDHLTCNGTPKSLLDNATTPSDKSNAGTSSRKKNVPYTRTGDKGTSQLMTGERRSKDSAVFDAMGTVDELCSTVGLAHSLVIAASSASSTTTNGSALTNGTAPSPDEVDLADCLVQVMSRLFDMGSHIAKPRKVRLRAEDDDDDHDSDSESHEFVPDGVGGEFDSRHVDDLEAWIDDMTDQLPELRSFILPTGSLASAQLHVSRCVCRRAERLVVSLVRDGVCDPNAVRYLNRLSDFLFVAARYANVKLEEEGRDEILYKKPSADARQRVAAASARGNGP